MAQRIEILLVDDVDGSKAVDTVTFALDGVTYEIDLNEAHAEELRAAVQAWASKARRTGGRRNASPGSSSSTSSHRSDIRVWARANGHAVGEKGRISRSIQEAYAAAH